MHSMLVHMLMKKKHIYSSISDDQHYQAKVSKTRSVFFSLCGPVIPLTANSVITNSLEEILYSSIGLCVSIDAFLHVHSDTLFVRRHLAAILDVVLPLIGASFVSRDDYKKKITNLLWFALEHRTKRWQKIGRAYQVILLVRMPRTLASTACCIIVIVTPLMLVFDKQRELRPLPSKSRREDPRASGRD